MIFLQRKIHCMNNETPFYDDIWWMIWSSFMYNHVLCCLPIPGRWDSDMDVNMNDAIILQKLYCAIDDLMLWDTLRIAGHDYSQIRTQLISDYTCISENTYIDLIWHITKIANTGWHTYRRDRKVMYRDRQRRLQFTLSVILYFSIIFIAVMTTNHIVLNLV